MQTKKRRAKGSAMPFWCSLLLIDCSLTTHRRPTTAHLPPLKGPGHARVVELFVEKFFYE
jgi:hypothetical protein